MMKNRSIVLLVIGVLSALMIYVLYQMSFRINESSNHFSRFIPTHQISKKYDMGFAYNGGYIAGFSDSNIYIAHSIYFDNLFSINTSNGDTQLIKVNINSDDTLRYGSTTTHVDSTGKIFILGSNLPGIYLGQIQDKQCSIYCANNMQYDLIIPVSDSLFVYRTLRKKIGYNLVSKNPFHTNTLARIELPKSEAGGIFGQDGMLQYDRASNTLVYLYYYKNKFVVADSNLQIRYEGRTIDTISVPKIKSGERNKNDVLYMASPPVVVNKNCCVSNGRLFVNSNLIAENEDRALFDNSAVIDVYDLVNKGKYKFSFHIRSYQSKKLKDFKVFGNLFVALYDHSLVVYDLIGLLKSR